jgi:hypothetical protein
MACCSKLTNLLRRIGAACCGNRRVKVKCPTIVLESTSFTGGTNPALFNFNVPVEVQGTVTCSQCDAGTDCSSICTPFGVDPPVVVVNQVQVTPSAPFKIFDYGFVFTVNLPGQPNCKLDVTVCFPAVE